MSIGTIWTHRDLIKREQGLEAALEFEQVVKKYQAEQIRYEQERIIKLLEEHAEGDLLFAQNLNTPSEDVAYTMFKGDVIALIKGEK